MKKLTTEEVAKLYAPLPDAPVEGTGGPKVKRLPRQCPTCDVKHEVESEHAVANPILRFELCPGCDEKEHQRATERQQAQSERLEDLPPTQWTAEDDYHD